MIAMLLVLLMMLPFAHADEVWQGDIRGNAFLLAQRLNAMTETNVLEKHLAMYGASADEVMAHVGTLCQGDRGEPVQAVSLTVELKDFLAQLGQESGFPALTDEQWHWLTRKLVLALPNAINGRYGVTAVLTMSMVRQSCVFAAPGQDAAGVYILLYDTGAPVMVTWYREQNAVSMSASFLEGAFDTAAVSQFTSELALMGIHAAEAADISESEPVIIPALSMQERAIAFAAQMTETMKVPAMQSVFSGNDEVMHLIGQWSAGDHQQPGAVYRINMDGLKDAGAALSGMMDASQLPDGMQLDELTLLGLLRTQLVARHLGDVSLAAVSTSTDTMILADADVTGSGAYLLMYPEGMPVLVTWTTGSGAVYMTAGFLPFEELADCGSAAEASLWFLGKGVVLQLEDAAR